MARQEARRQVRFPRPTVARSSRRTACDTRQEIPFAEREIVMLALTQYLGQATTEFATATTATGADEVRTAFTGLLLMGALATFAAIVSTARRLLRQVVELIEELVRILLFALLAGLVVAAVIILAVADLMAG
jgi:hypothetical protein